MKRCRDYEVELSAMLDGESDPATAVRLLDHVTRCPACCEFYQELRSFQSLVDGLPSDGLVRQTSTPVPGPERRERRWGWLGGTPRWAWGAAAAAIVVVAGLWLADVVDVLDGSTSERSQNELVVQVGGGKDQLDEKRFVELAVEILGADPRYQNEMYEILGELRRGGELGEIPSGDERNGDEAAESRSEIFATVGGPAILN